MTAESPADGCEQTKSGGGRCVALQRFEQALSNLERSIEQVRIAAQELAPDEGNAVPPLRVLDELQRILQDVQTRDGRETTTWTDQSAKTNLALDALWSARKELRKTPAAAVERLAAVDLDGVDSRVVQEVYGAWLRQCRRLGLSSPFRYEAGFGRGAIALPMQRGGLRVVSSIGMPEWPPGTHLTWRDVPGAKPLE
jgi:hypothetical protein